MRYIWQHIRVILDSYDGSLPLAHFLKTYLRKYPKLGSRDRKILSEMAYCYYRFSKGLPDGLSFEQKLQSCIFLGEMNLPQILQLIPVAWQQPLDSMEDKVLLLKEQGIVFDKEKIASAGLKLSEGISYEDWLGSILSQPRLFIRIRKDQDKILDILKENQVAYELTGDHCVSLPNGTAVDKMLPADSYVVQDASSQATGAYFKPETGQEWWDACSGAGGKSLMLKDLQPRVSLTVSDKRESILQNLKERFKQYHHQAPVSFVADLTDASLLKDHPGSKRFDGIICDVPCTGSGTWARTPEQLYFFKEAQLARYAEMQKQIVINASAYLKPGGRLIYITCSVFHAENEDAVQYISEKGNLKLLEKQLINGTGQKADSMFAAVFVK